MRGEQFELKLWNAIAEASKTPEDADLVQVWGILDQALVGLDMRSQLQIAGEAVGQLANLFSCRANFLFEELNARDLNNDPQMSESAFDRYVIQKIVVNFDQFIESFDRLPRITSERFKDGNSIAGVVDKEVLIQVLEQENILTAETEFEEAIASTHVEDISAWIGRISQYLEGEDSAICLTKLQAGLGMQMVEVWMGLLLGEFCLEQRGEFYDRQIWINLKVK